MTDEEKVMAYDEIVNKVKPLHKQEKKYSSYSYVQRNNINKLTEKEIIPKKEEKIISRDKSAEKKENEPEKNNNKNIGITYVSNKIVVGTIK